MKKLCVFWVLNNHRFCLHLSTFNYVYLANKRRVCIISGCVGILVRIYVLFLYVYNYA